MKIQLPALPRTSAFAKATAAPLRSLAVKTADKSVRGNKRRAVARR